ncbi:hypothetical protein AAMO2058_000267600 [Amorphochlora amoebiformis]
MSTKDESVIGVQTDNEDTKRTSLRFIDAFRNSLRKSEELDTKERKAKQEKKDGEPRTRISFSKKKMTVWETEETINIEIVRSGPLDVAYNVRVMSEDGTAKTGTNFSHLDDIVKFKPGQAKKIVKISIFNDPDCQGKMKFSVKLLPHDDADEDNLGESLEVQILDIDSRWSSKVRTSECFSRMVVFGTVFALFVHDIWIMSNVDPAYDNILGWLTVVVSLLFIFEYVVNTHSLGTKYVLSTNGTLDLLAAVGVITLVRLEFGRVRISFETIFDIGVLARVARFARIAGRAGRATRIPKLLGKTVAAVIDLVMCCIQKSHEEETKKTETDTGKTESEVDKKVPKGESDSATKASETKTQNVSEVRSVAINIADRSPQISSKPSRGTLEVEMTNTKRVTFEDQKHGYSNLSHGTSRWNGGVGGWSSGAVSDRNLMQRSTKMRSLHRASGVFIMSGMQSNRTEDDSDIEDQESSESTSSFAEKDTEEMVVEPSRLGGQALEVLTSKIMLMLLILLLLVSGLASREIVEANQQQLGLEMLVVGQNSTDATTYQQLLAKYQQGDPGGTTWNSGQPLIYLKVANVEFVNDAKIDWLRYYEMSYAHVGGACGPGTYEEDLRSNSCKNAAIFNQRSLVYTAASNGLILTIGLTLLVTIGMAFIAMDFQLFIFEPIGRIKMSIERAVTLVLLGLSSGLDFANDEDGDEDPDVDKLDDFDPPSEQKKGSDKKPAADAPSPLSAPNPLKLKVIPPTDEKEGKERAIKMPIELGEDAAKLNSKSKEKSEKAERGGEELGSSLAMAINAIRDLFRAPGKKKISSTSIVDLGFLSPADEEKMKSKAERVRERVELVEKYFPKSLKTAWSKLIINVGTALVDVEKAFGVKTRRAGEWLRRANKVVNIIFDIREGSIEQIKARRFSIDWLVTQSTEKFQREYDLNENRVLSMIVELVVSNRNLESLASAIFKAYHIRVKNHKKKHHNHHHHDGEQWLDVKRFREILCHIFQVETIRLLKLLERSTPGLSLTNTRRRVATVFRVGIRKIQKGTEVGRAAKLSFIVHTASKIVLFDLIQFAINSAAGIPNPSRIAQGYTSDPTDSIQTLINEAELWLRAVGAHELQRMLPHLKIEKVPQLSFLSDELRHSALDSDEGAKTQETKDGKNLGKRISKTKMHLPRNKADLFKGLPIHKYISVLAPIWGLSLPYFKSCSFKPYLSAFREIILHTQICRRLGKGLLSFVIQALCYGLSQSVSSQALSGALERVAKDNKKSRSLLSILWRFYRRDPRAIALRKARVYINRLTELDDKGQRLILQPSPSTQRRSKHHSANKDENINNFTPSSRTALSKQSTDAKENLLENIVEEKVETTAGPRKKALSAAAKGKIEVLQPGSLHSSADNSQALGDFEHGTPASTPASTKMHHKPVKQYFTLLQARALNDLLTQTVVAATRVSEAMAIVATPPPNLTIQKTIHHFVLKTILKLIPMLTVSASAVDKKFQIKKTVEYVEKGTTEDAAEKGSLATVHGALNTLSREFRDNIVLSGLRSYGIVPNLDIRDNLFAFEAEWRLTHELTKRLVDDGVLTEGFLHFKIEGGNSGLEGMVRRVDDLYRHVANVHIAEAISKINLAEVFPTIKPPLEFKFDRGDSPKKLRKKLSKIDIGKLEDHPILVGRRQAFLKLDLPETAGQFFERWVLKTGTAPLAMLVCLWGGLRGSLLSSWRFGHMARNAVFDVRLVGMTCRGMVETLRLGGGVSTAMSDTLGVPLEWISKLEINVFDEAKNLRKRVKDGTFSLMDVRKIIHHFVTVSRSNAIQRIEFLNELGASPLVINALEAADSVIHHADVMLIDWSNGATKVEGKGETKVNRGNSVDLNFLSRNGRLWLERAVRLAVREANVLVQDSKRDYSLDVERLVRVVHNKNLSFGEAWRRCGIDMLAQVFCQSSKNLGPEFKDVNPDMFNRCKTLAEVEAIAEVVLVRGTVHKLTKSGGPFENARVDQIEALCKCKSVKELKQELKKVQRSKLMEGLLKLGVSMQSQSSEANNLSDTYLHQLAKSDERVARMVTEATKFQEAVTSILPQDLHFLIHNAVNGSWWLSVVSHTLGLDRDRVSSMLKSANPYTSQKWTVKDAARAINVLGELGVEAGMTWINAPTRQLVRTLHKADNSMIAAMASRGFVLPKASVDSEVLTQYVCHEMSKGVENALDDLEERCGIELDRDSILSALRGEGKAVDPTSDPSPRPRIAGRLLDCAKAILTDIFDQTVGDKFGVDQKAVSEIIAKAKSPKEALTSLEKLATTAAARVISSKLGSDALDAFREDIKALREAKGFKDGARIIRRVNYKSAIAALENISPGWLPEGNPFPKSWGELEALGRQNEQIAKIINSSKILEAVPESISQAISGLMGEGKSDELQVLIQPLLQGASTPGEFMQKLVLHSKFREIAKKHLAPLLKNESLKEGAKIIQSEMGSIVQKAVSVLVRLGSDSTRNRTGIAGLVQNVFQANGFSDPLALVQALISSASGDQDEEEAKVNTSKEGGTVDLEEIKADLVSL